MKNLYLLTLSIVLLISCESKDKRYTQESPEIDAYKNVIENYEKQDWEAFSLNYADSAKIMNNVTEDKSQTLAELISINKEDFSLFTEIDFVDKESVYEMIIDDKGETWVNFWGLWKGTLKSNGITYDIPVHITSKFVEGKIVKEFGYWNTTEVHMAILESAAPKITVSE